MSPNFFRFVRVNKRIVDTWETETSLLFTFEFSGDWFGIISDPTLDSFSDTWGDESLSETYEHGQSYSGTISDGTLASFSDTWTDESLSGGEESW